MAKKITKDEAPAQNYPKMAVTRLDQLRATMEDQKVDAIVVNYLSNIRYLSNFSGSSATMIITTEDMHFFTDDRYEEQIKTELYNLPNLQTYITRDVWKTVKTKKVLKNVEAIAFESDRMTYADAVRVRNELRPLKFKPATNLVERFTVPKAPEELVFIAKSCEIAEKTFDHIIEMIKPGVSELDLALEISYYTRKLGSEGEAFDTIVTSGPRGAIIHGTPSNRKLKVGDIVLFDYGCKVHGFCSDISRTVAVGKATKDQKKLYKTILHAKETAIENVRPGMNAKNLDAYARDIIKKEGFGDCFQHSLGHGIGLVAHEMPIVTFRMDDQIVPCDAVLAIEPGVYFPEKYGMRIEDMIQVTRNGGKHLTNAPDELLVVG